MKALAKTYASDAELIFVAGGNISENGDGQWNYVFKSIAQQETYQFYSTLTGIIGISESVTGFFSKEGFLNLEPLPDSWLEIDAALTIAGNRGGTEFRQNYPECVLEAYLFISPEGYGLNWEINYNSEPMGGQWMHFYIDATVKSRTEDWPKTYGGIQSEIGLSVQETNEGGFIIVGYTNSFGHGMFDTWLIKTDSLGNEEWNKIYGGPYND